MNLIATTRRSNGYDLSPFSSLLNLNRFWNTPLEAAVRASSEWVDSPTLDLHENKDNYLVQLEVPGVDRKDIKISIDQDILTIAGERKAEKVGEDTEVHRQERFFGRFERQVRLPKAVAQGQVSAAYVNGVLTVTLPKAPEAKPREIEIAAN